MCRLDNCVPTDTHAGIIYGLHNGDGRYRYIGMTTNKDPKHYFQTHQSRARTRKSWRYVHIWMREEGVEDIQMDIIEIIHPDMVALIGAIEQLYIADYRAIGLADTNGTDGGEGTVGRVMTDDHKAKISAANSGRVKSAEWLAKCVATRRERGGYTFSHTDEAKAKITAGLTGRAVSDDTRSKLSEKATGRVMSDDAKVAMKLAAHRRWHEKREITKPDCQFCVV